MLQHQELVINICKNVETLDLLDTQISAQAAQSSSIITKANKYLKNLILSCLVIFVYLFIYMFLVKSAFSSISHSISTCCCIAARSAFSSISHFIFYSQQLYFLLYFSLYFLLYFL